MRAKRMTGKRERPDEKSNEKSSEPRTRTENDKGAKSRHRSRGKRHSVKGERKEERKRKSGSVEGMRSRAQRMSWWGIDPSTGGEARSR